MSVTRSTRLLGGEVQNPFEKCIITHVRFFISTFEIGDESFVFRTVRLPFIVLRYIGNLERSRYSIEDLLFFFIAKIAIGDMHVDLLLSRYDFEDSRIVWMY